MKSTQKEAVFAAVMNVLKEAKRSATEGQAVTLSKEERAKVNAILFSGFRSGDIEISHDAKVNPSDDSSLKGYVSGLQSNWLRKDKRLNGGGKYVAKNPGSRAGSGDTQLKNLKLLFGTLKTDEEREEVQGYIDARVEAIAASKTKAVTIDYTALPADLAAKFQK